jgi:hypothetical protein
MVRESLTEVGECLTLDRMSISEKENVVTYEMTACYADTLCFSGGKTGLELSHEVSKARRFRGLKNAAPGLTSGER